MVLEDINIKIKYDSDKDDMISDFYIPVLSNSQKYCRLSGFFSSSSLATVARGMENFIKNNGKMYLICSAILSKEDISIIEETNENPSKILESYLINSLDDIEDEFIKDHVAALGWMLANNNLEIKIAIVSEKGGMFHQKVGILEDDEGNAISFSGSNNETANGLKYNVEDFKVFKNWDNGQKEYFEQDYESFNNYWNGLSERTKVINLPEAIAEKIIEIAPNHIDEINLNNYSSKPVNDVNTDEKIVLRDYQKEAIENWWENGKKGILEMATGTGKTLTALSCFSKIFHENENLITVIACPQSHLIDQWIKDVKKFYKGQIIVASSKNHKWKTQIKNLIINSILDIEKNFVIVTTHKTLSSVYFIENIKKSKAKLLLIVDEVHGIGSLKQLKALDDSYNYRLGLSATPERWFDNEGTNYIMKYFGGVVFEFNIGDALNTINSGTGEYYLTPYIYKPILVDLNSEEFELYEYLTAGIANILNSEKKDRSKLDSYCFKRQGILNNAEEKYEKLIGILDENKNIKDLIVFCSPQQIDKVQKILNDKKITQHKFTNAEKVRKEEKYGGFTERDYLIKKFEDGSYKALVAMKCLDEGVDIPSARNAIIMSSTSNPREHVQRRGRILRHFQGKKEAIIYDMLVFPDDGSEISSKIIKKEAERYREFAINAKNSMKCIEFLKKNIMR
ncbi:DEAD/DEAH box helicase family protein [Methanobrevibacter filiformis]|uniref:ATP-dependent RNA helicase DbpA n=1 Tax=Methanobrevibacter filiformis TaxID=55758 RepID=A0A162FBR3_9EURY|nr:DEAD/DEAH box helicase family protein [Methanobrevibacter filiformis]KZX10675.1 ATP-dependent RNA helicase DbpA [Methanobrevibacter filiformis]